MGIGLSIGIAIGVPLGLLFENIGIGIAIGIALGSGIGASLEQRNKDNVRLLTEQEKKMQQWGVILGLLIMALAVGVIILLLFSRIK